MEHDRHSISVEERKEKGRGQRGRKARRKRKKNLWNVSKIYTQLNQTDPDDSLS